MEEKAKNLLILSEAGQETRKSGLTNASCLLKLMDI